ncbi:MAG: metallophosphoesterase [Clostridia bacterium]|nr:metallophosphoesterase [Clostridia bacterium]
MKKSLSILLTLIFTFSCFSVLGTGMVFAETAQPPYISVVDTDGNPHKYGADIGAKVDVKANEDGSNTFTLTYDNMDSTNVFMGWYNGETFLSADTTFTAPSGVNKDNVKAKILCRSVISGGLGFESYTATTSLRVAPDEKADDVIPSDDKWGQISKNGYRKKSDTVMPIQAVYGSKSINYTSEYKNGSYTQVSTTVKPYSGNSMFNFAARARSVVRKLDNLKPNTSYELSFYVYNSSRWDFLERLCITDYLNIKPSELYPTLNSTGIVKVYAYYLADTMPCDENGKDVLKSEAMVRNWTKISVNFTTDADDTELYLHLAQAVGNDSGKTSNIFLDNFTCSETVIGYVGNSIRAEEPSIPQALRYKFSINKKLLNAFAGMAFKKLGLLAVKSEVCGADTLEIGKEYNANGVVTKVKDYEVKEKNYQSKEGDSVNTYFTAALYNIGVNEDGTNYSEYGNDYAVRPYIIYEDANGKEKVIYGNTINANVFGVVHSIVNENISADDVKVAKNLLANKDISEKFYNWQGTDGWYIGESKATDYAYSFAIIGDIQKTTKNNPEKLHYIYDWIVDNKNSKNIQYVMSMGDLTDGSSDTEWVLARDQHLRLENAGINQSIVRGNHDSISKYDKYITTAKFGTKLDSSYKNMRNTCRLITISGVKYMMLTLDLFPSAEEIAWAENLITTHSDYNVILSTHAYFNNMSYEGNFTYNTEVSSSYSSKKLEELNDGRTADDLYSGKEIYDSLVSKYSNIVLVLCGHNDPYDDGPNFRTVTRADGSKVVEMMTNFQGVEEREGRAYGTLAMLYFSNDGKTVQVEFFSTVSSMFYKQKFQTEFEIDLKK